jgi:fumarate reductase subunit D
MSTGSIAAKGRRTGRSPLVERFGRAGLVAKAALYAVIGILAFKVAFGADEESPDKSGALRTIAQQPFGKVLLVLLAVGLAGYALWRLAQALFDRDDEGEGPKGLAKRGVNLGKAAWYGTLCVLTVSTLVGNGGGDTNEQQTTAGVFERPLGRYVVYAVGIAFAGAALFNLWRAITCKFKKKLKTQQMNEAEESASTAVGVVGHLARFVVFGLVGAFLVEAAWKFDPKQARGLDGALLEVSQRAYGGILLAGVAVGLLAYAAYCLVEARYRRI